MTSIFLASWEICLDKSMSIWHSRWTYPVWIFFPQKTHPFGTEWHTACCALSDILFVVELVEGKAHPRQADPLEFEDLSRKNVGLLLRMMKIYFSTGRYVILDSGFYVLKGLIQLRDKGIFSCAVIKKRRYWPSMVPGKDMEDHFGEVEVGETYAIHGTVDDAIYNLWGMKEPNYLTRMMATGGRLFTDDTFKETVRIWKEYGEDVVKKFKYNMPFN